MITGLICGVIAGFAACKITGREGKGCLLDLILGVVGGAIGGLVFDWVGIETVSWLGEMISAVIGAIIVLWICNKIF